MNIRWSSHPPPQPKNLSSALDPRGWAKTSTPSPLRLREQRRSPSSPPDYFNWPNPKRRRRKRRKEKEGRTRRQVQSDRLKVKTVMGGAVFCVLVSSYITLVFVFRKQRCSDVGFSKRQWLLHLKSELLTPSRTADSVCLSLSAWPQTLPQPSRHTDCTIKGQRSGRVTHWLSWSLSQGNRLLWRLSCPRSNNAKLDGFRRVCPAAGPNIDSTWAWKSLTWPITSKISFKCCWS